ncbi:hypothetical protein BN159_1294 [Streptomyces davaonensis JCM 4913]|uniref:PASTA domain-containing protein n=1 Tax=Streptomyces davaonensis (strain DSM 101723 / JCM 4913 / KCC S-0913 / 768) TaxID=1214101 RepID=K4QX98_STRDJ|nr:PASTA domain-containing protein [Streptomyces davaonensis]CCK25673.1 hypothetical protein BN159_1294 [Streptomyces davaonensis JCM 4913]
MKRTRGRARGSVALVVVLVVVGLMATACVSAGRVAVQAVARGVPTASPFFKKAIGLGADVALGEALSHIGGEVRGDEPGLYGGAKDSARCDKAKLVDFLGRPENRRKAEEWARVQRLDSVREIPGFVKKLTPVLLRGDTLIKNHDYKKGKATAFYALLEAGIAVLVDELGRPAVQCSCGNPLDAYDRDVEGAQVEFKGDNKKWASYDEKKMTKVRPAPEQQPVEVYELVDVEDPDTGLAREVGSDGTDDEVLPESPSPTGEPSSEETATSVVLPEVTGMPVDQARELLESQGMRSETTEETSDTHAPGTVISQTPLPGETAPPGSVVTLVVASGPPPVTDPPVTEEPTDGSVPSADSAASAPAADSGGATGG